MKRAAVLALLTLLTAAGYAFGCEVRPLELKGVRSEFDVYISHRGKPIAGIRVEVAPKGTTDLAFQSSSDDRGIVHVVGLTRGEYYLTASHLGFEAGKAWIEVIDAGTADTKTVTRINLEWADWSYETSRVAGILTGLAPGNTGHPLKDLLNPVHAVYPGVEITLRNAFSDEEYHGVSDSSGSFIFGATKPGIYLLTIAGGAKSVVGVASETNLILDVVPASKRDYLKLKLQGTGCYGVEYALDEPQ